MILLHCGIDGAQLCAGLIKGSARSETAENLGHTMNAARDHGCGKMMRAGDDVRDNFGILRIRDAGFEHANDCGRAIADAAEAKGFADNGSVLVKGGGPEPIGEHDNAGSFGPIILRADEAAEHGMKAHHVKIGATHSAPSNRARLAEKLHHTQFMDADDVREIRQAIEKSPELRRAIGVEIATALGKPDGIKPDIAGSKYC